MKRALVVAAIAFAAATLAVSVSALYGNVTRESLLAVDASETPGKSEVMLAIGYVGLSLAALSGAGILVLGPVVLFRSARHA
ncbi:hypothetical protein [Marisediminicola sp. LYQ85]|uniref:hypothetical protein n=1 Tax=Marisediminicola sp. LYQ85 TaxID=3391062 RepID=UPI0039833368